jgi:hypothetical protein
MPLDPQTQTLLERLKAIDFRLTRGLTPVQVRAWYCSPSVPAEWSRAE